MELNQGHLLKLCGAELGSNLVDQVEATNKKNPKSIVVVARDEAHEGEGILLSTLSRH